MRIAVWISVIVNSVFILLFICAGLIPNILNVLAVAVGAFALRQDYLWKHR